MWESPSRGDFTIMYITPCIVLFTKDVTPENFLNILQGNAEAMSGIGSGKVLRRWGRPQYTVNI